MAATQELPTLGPIARYEQSIIDRITDFNDPHQEWRRLFSELLGTFLLVMVAAGGGMMSQSFPGAIGRSAAVVAPGLMVMGIILFMGSVSGAHLNPAVTLAFALRRDFPWRRVPGYVVAQGIGAVFAVLTLVVLLRKQGTSWLALLCFCISTTTAMFWEMLLTAGLVSTILGTCSGA